MTEEKKQSWTGCLVWIIAFYVIAWLLAQTIHHDPPYSGPDFNAEQQYCEVTLPDGNIVSGPCN